MQSLIEIGSEMWICIRYKTNKQNEQKTISALYIRLGRGMSVAGYVPRRPRPDPGPVHVRSEADKVALGQVLLLVLLFPLSAPFHQCSVLILTYMLLTRTTARPANLQINNALPDNRGSFDIHVTTLSLRLSLLGIQPGMRVHCELPRRPAPTDAALHRVKVRHGALTLQHLQAVIMYSNAIFLSAIRQLHHPRTCRHQKSCRQALST